MKVEKKNTGSAKNQIIVFTKRIKHLTEHLKQNKKDFSAKKAMLDLVNKRHSMLKYMDRKEPENCKKLCTQLSLRKL